MKKFRSELVQRKKSVWFNKSASLGNWLRASVLCLFRKTGTAHWAENMEIVLIGPSNPGFEPTTFQSQVQHSTYWATGAPQNLSIGTFLSRIRNCNLPVTSQTLYWLSYRGSPELVHWDLPIPDSNLQPSSHKSNTILTELPGLPWTCPLPFVRTTHYLYHDNRILLLEFCQQKILTTISIVWKWQPALLSTHFWLVCHITSISLAQKVLI